MRIWSLHPKYLDTKGLVALWREALLAKKVLEGNTRGYKNHPQLIRFRKAKHPTDLINQYLSEVYNEAVRRNFDFDQQKIDWAFKKSKVPVTTGQLNYEAKHLLIKLEKRDYNKYTELKSRSAFDIHPVFKLVVGETEEWEISAKAGKNAGR
jgi:hypothetical protein